MNATTAESPAPVSIATDPRRPAAPPGRRRWPVAAKLGVFAAVLAGLAAAVYFLGPRGLRWAASLPAVRDALEAAQADSSSEEGRDHERGDHDGRDHGAADPNVLELSPQARKNIGLATTSVKLEPFDPSLTVPAMIVERPGRSVIEVSAPLTGVVTRVYPIQGEALAPGQPLFDLRMTHEELVQAQGDYLQSIEQLDVVRQEIARLEKLTDIAGKSLLERKYEEQKLEAALHSQRQALLLHGLSEPQVDEIAGTRMLIEGMPVLVPQVAEAQRGERLLQVQELKVEQGQHVEAGQTLCVLVDHALLYVEGKAFSQDAAALERAAANGWTLTLLPSGGTEEDSVAGLEVLYVADRVDADSRALHFYIRLPNELVTDKTDAGHRFVGWRFKPGQRAEVRVPFDRWEGRIVLPTAAVVRDGPDAYVFQQTGKKFTRRPVAVEYSDPMWTVLANDGSIYVGDIVVTAGADLMQIALKNRSGGAIDPHAGHNH